MPPISTASGPWLRVLAGAIGLGLLLGGCGAAATTRQASDPVSTDGLATRSLLTLPDTGGSWKIRVHGWTRTIVRGGQRTIDHCRATLWEGPLPGATIGTTWLAGHDYCGFYRWDRWLPVGSRFTVTDPRGRTLKYVVFDRGAVSRHHGSSAGLIRGDVTLQTCRGRGTSFTYARLVAPLPAPRMTLRSAGT